MFILSLNCNGSNEYQPLAWKTTQQNVRSVPQSKQLAMDIKPNQTERQTFVTLTQYEDIQEQHHEETIQALQPGATLDCCPKVTKVHLVILSLLRTSELK